MNLLIRPLSAFQFRHSQQFSEIIKMHKVFTDTIAIGAKSENPFQRRRRNDSPKRTFHRARISCEVSTSFERMRKEQSREDRGFLITLPRLFGWVIQLQLWRQSNNWTFNVRVWNPRPDDSPIFKCALDGDIAGLERIISARQASLYDVTLSGITLLHVRFH